MTLDEHAAYREQLVKAAERRKATLKHRLRLARRAFKTACAVVTVGFGLLMIACTASDFFAGVSTLIGAALGMAWAVAGVVCGVETFRGPIALIGRANDIDMAQERDQ
ncbi:hypothetical protein ASD47_15630 [Caulobacter sp. Root1472]|nr:hypothetical protein ASD47_15630 [Caulobacter sp. Root1472]